jgi:hypothetical protein
MRLAEERGFGAKLCEPEADRIDVMLKCQTLTIGCAIVLVTTADQEREHLREWLNTGHSRVLVVSPDRERRKRIGKLIPALSGAARIDIVAPEDIAAFLDEISVRPDATESKVGTYTVRVTGPTASPEEHEARRAAVAEIIAKSLKRARNAPR